MKKPASIPAVEFKGHVEKALELARKGNPLLSGKKTEFHLDPHIIGFVLRDLKVAPNLIDIAHAAKTVGEGLDIHAQPVISAGDKGLIVGFLPPADIAF